MEAVILAGGLGTRLKSVTGETPKPMVPVAGRPFLEHLLNFWRKQGVSRFLLSVAYKPEKIRAHFGHEFHGIPVDYAVDEGWGTGGGVVQAAALRKEKNLPFLVVNGDTFFEVSLPDFLKFHREKKGKASLALAKVTDGSRYGAVTLGTHGNITSFGQGAGPAFINGGIYLFEPDFLMSYPFPQTFSLEKDFFPKAAADGILFGYQSSGRFIDIGTPESYLECEKWFQGGEKNHA